MLIKKSIPWGEIEWTQFEDLLVDVARTEMGELNLERHLKTGNNQEGIDILGYHYSDNKYTCIQCKNTKYIDKKTDAAKLTLISKAVERFLNGKFKAITKKFIIAVNEDLQTKKTQSFIIEQRERFRKEFKIEFQVWDIQTIELRLKDLPECVGKYFGKDIVDSHCFFDTHIPTNIFDEIVDFIDRTIVKIDKPSNDSYRFPTVQMDNYKIDDILLSNLSISKKICLLGDAYEGKTTLLKQLSYILFDNKNFWPIYVQIKDYYIRPIADILDELFNWKKYPYQKIIIIVDGVDEIATSEFDNFILSIREFCSKYYTVNFIFSCRRLFYDQYTISDSLPSFSFYELSPLREKDIEKYIEYKLYNRAIKFKENISTLRLEDLLQYPFYLTTLVDFYKRSLFPQNKVEVFNLLVKESFQRAKGRKLSLGRRLAHVEFDYSRCLAELALSMQMLGLNTIADYDLQRLFELFEIELLEHSSVLTKTRNTWTFNNAFFQENLAAQLLARLSFDQIAKIATVGKQIRKIKTKWVQTIASAFSYLQDNDKYQALIKLVEDDNINLLTLADSTKFPKNIKLDIFKRIIARFTKLNGRLALVYEDSLAKFIDNMPEAVELLLEIISTDGNNESFKFTCWLIIAHLSLQNDQKNTLLTLSEKELRRSLNPGYAGNILRVLAKQQLVIEREFIVKLIKLKELSEYNSFRNEVYLLLIANGMVDEFYDYCLDGIEFAMSNKNNNNKYYFSIKSLLRLLLAANEPKNIKRLISNNKFFEWKNAYRFRDEKGIFIKQIVPKLIETYENEHWIIFSVVKMAGKLFKNLDRAEYTGIETFFAETKTNLLAFKLLLPEMVNCEWELSILMTEECIQYLIEEIEEGRIENRIVMHFINGLTFWNKENLANQLNTYYTDLTGKSFAEPNSLWKEYENYEIKKRENDIKYIQSKTALIDGVTKMIDGFGDKCILSDDLYKVYEDKSIATNSNLVFFLLQELLIKKSDIDVGFCVELIEKHFYFIRSYLIHYKADSSIKSELISFLEEYYSQNILLFPTDCGDENKLLIDIYKKYQFPTDANTLIKMLGFDEGGIHNIENARLNKKVALSQLIVENVERTLLSNAIVQNLNDGISESSILGNHIGLCKILEIREAAPIILNLLLDEKVYKYDRSEAVKIYLDLGGEKSYLISIFQKLEYSDEEFLFSLATLLRVDYQSDVEKKLLSFFNSATIDEADKIKLANQLIAIGNCEAFNYIISYLLNNNHSPFDTFSASGISNIKVDFALKELEKIIHTVLEFDDNIPSYKAAGSLVLDYVNSLALKSEENLLKVEQFLISSEKRLNASYANSSNLLIYLDNILEKFRENDENNYSIEDVKQLIVNTRL